FLARVTARRRGRRSATAPRATKSGRKRLKQRAGSTRRLTVVAGWLWLVALAFAFITGCAKSVPATTTSTVREGASGPGGSVVAVYQGRCSWYGREQHGHLTANGEHFDMYALTAAHRTLRMNTRVRVTNLRNGRATVVRINDRGPYGRGRIIDVSY